MIKYLKKKITYVRLGLVTTFSYFIFKSVILFYRGYRNLDLSYNYLRQGFTTDLTTQEIAIKLTDGYLMGLNQMVGGFGWLCLVCIIGIILGFSLGVKDNGNN